MTAPRHLWSGDWQLESSAHAEDLAARRGRSQPPETPAAPEPDRPTPPRKRPRRGIRHLWARVRTPDRRRLRIGAVTAVAALLLATAAYAVASSDSSKDTSPQTAAVSGSQAWLGVRLANAPIRGALVASVIHGSPAAAAGIRPGDVITQLDTQPIVTPAIFVSAISGMQPGDHVDIALQRGASQYTAQVTLASPPAGSP